MKRIFHGLDASKTIKNRVVSILNKSVTYYSLSIKSMHSLVPNKNSNTSKCTNILNNSYLNQNKTKFHFSVKRKESGVVNTSNDSVKLEGNLIINQEKEILIYFDKSTLSDKLRFHIPKLSVLSALGLFAAKNPLYLSLPAALPVVVFYLAYKILMYLLLIIQRKSIVYQIWLDRSSEYIRIIYNKSIRNSEKEELVINLDNIPTDITNVGSESLHYEDFPLSNSKNKSPTIFQYWRKAVSTDKQYIILKKSPLYSKLPVLIEVLNNRKVELGVNTAYELNLSASEAEQLKAIKGFITMDNIK